MDGARLGDNAKALLMTRALTEMARLTERLGGRRDTLAGLAGVGDLIVTCTSMHSRNRRAGILIGQGKSAKEAMAEVGAVVFENNETEFPGIFACGNALHVHDLADAVAEESARAGSAAARFVRSGACRTDAVLELKTGEAVACIVPMKLRKTNLEDQVDISLRVRKVFGKNAYLTVAQGNRQLARFARAYLSPSRMERLRLPGRLLEALDPAAGPLTVSVTGEEE